MKMRTYIALIHKDPHSEFGVSFPDFPGCISAGASLDQARANAEEALAFHVEGMAEDGEAIPEPSSLEDIMAEPDNRDGVAVLIPLREQAARTVRVTSRSRKQRLPRSIATPRRTDSHDPDFWRKPPSARWNEPEGAQRNLRYVQFLPMRPRMCSSTAAAGQQSSLSPFAF